MKQLERCGAGGTTKKKAENASTKTLGGTKEVDVDDPAFRKAVVDKFVKEHIDLKVDVDKVAEEAKILKPTIESLDKIAETSLAQTGKLELKIGENNYEMSNLRRVDYLLEVVSKKEFTPAKVAKIDLPVLLAYQRGGANSLEIPPPSVRAMHVGLPAVIPHMSKNQAKEVLSQFPLNLKIQPPTEASSYAKTNADIYYKNVRFAQAHALKVLEESDPRAFGYEVKKLAKLEN